MSNKELFFSKILSDIKPKKQELSEFCQLFLEKNFKDKSFIIKEEDDNNYIYFIESGVVKLYLTDFNGNDAIFRFAKEFEFVKGSFANKVISPINIQCITDCSLYVGDWDRVLEYSLRKSNFRDYFNMEMAKGYQRIIQLNSTYIRLKAKERYILFIEQYPGLIDRIPHYMISNYLGISSVQLSRIRRELKNN